MKKVLLVLLLMTAGCVSHEFSEPLSEAELEEQLLLLENMTARSQLLFIEDELKINEPAHVYVAVHNVLDEAIELDMVVEGNDLVNVLYDRNNFLFLSGKKLIFPFKIVPLQKGVGSVNITITHEDTMYARESFPLVVR